MRPGLYFFNWLIFAAAKQICQQFKYLPLYEFYSELIKRTPFVYYSIFQESRSPHLLPLHPAQVHFYIYKWISADHEFIEDYNFKSSA